MLFVHSRRAKFVVIDRALLAERWTIRDRYQPGRWGNPLGALVDVARSDLVFGWFASWHTFWPIVFARLLRRPSILIVGGFDTANMPEIGYGLQRGRLTRRLVQFVTRSAGTVVTNSHASQREIEANMGLPAARVTVLYHGVPDPYGTLPTATRERLALTVGVVVRANLERKGLRRFVEAAAHAPDVRFVLVGSGDADLLSELRAGAPPNVHLTGWVPDADLDSLYRRASAYVQVSRHEGFGLAVAEAMVGGCVPVVSRAGALPEVVGEAGVILADDAPERIAAAVRATLAAPIEDRARARDRVLTEFPLEKRRAGLWSLVDAALARSTRAGHS